MKKKSSSSAAKRVKKVNNSSYFNEFEKIYSTSIDRHVPADVPLANDYNTLRNSLALMPYSKLGVEDSAASNMRRYFQSQARWYSDMRSEVGIGSRR